MLGWCRISPRHKLLRSDWFSQMQELTVALLLPVLSGQSFSLHLQRGFWNILITQSLGHEHWEHGTCRLTVIHPITCERPGWRILPEVVTATTFTAPLSVLR